MESTHFTVARKAGLETAYSRSDPQKPSMVEILVVKTSYDNTDLLLKTDLKQLQTEIAAWKLFFFGVDFHQNTYCKFGWRIPTSDKEKLVQSLLEEKYHFKKISITKSISF